MVRISVTTKKSQRGEYCFFLLQQRSITGKLLILSLLKQKKRKLNPYSIFFKIFVWLLTLTWKKEGI